MASVRCQTPEEADSIACEPPNRWDSSTRTCQGPCTLPDSVWQGDPSCAYDYNRGQYLNGINLYRRVNCEITSEFQTYYSSTCDTTEQDSTWQCIAIFGDVVQLRKGNSNTIVSCRADGSCSAAIAKIIDGQCGDFGSSSSQRPRSSSSESEGSSSDSENPDSSPSGGGSSGSTGGSSDSGGSGGGDNPDEGSSSSGGIWDDYSSGGEGGDGGEGGMSDNALLQVIAQNTAVTAQNTGNIAEYTMTFLPNISDATWEISGVAHDINTNTRSIIEHQENIDNATGSIDNKLSSTNNLLQQIVGKNWSPNINVQAPSVSVDVSGVIAAQQQQTDSIHNTNSILQGMKSAIDGIGGRLDTMSIKVDTSKAPASIDSSLKFWGDSRNRNLGTAGLDSSGWGAIGQDVISFGDSMLSSFTGIFSVNGCDTTGGKKCDGSIIGAGGLDSSRNSTRRVYGELRDSLLHGQFADSLNAWGSKFTGNGVLTGSGSNNCPSFLSRRHTIQIGIASVDMQLDGVMCATLFGSVTPWTLARLLIRSIVAFFCMVFLFKAATGFGSGGDE